MMGDPARANMLMALMSGMALTSNELAREASVSASTASTHLSQMEWCGLVSGRKQGRFKYFSLSPVSTLLMLSKRLSPSLLRLGICVCGRVRRTTRCEGLGRATII